jgi:hypothetical protein
VGSFFALQIAVSFSSNRDAKRCFFRTDQLYDKKAEAFKTQEYVQTQITTVGQTSGLVSQATAYKAEIDVKWLTKRAYRWCLSICSKIKRKLENVL